MLVDVRDRLIIKPHRYWARFHGDNRIPLVYGRQEKSDKNKTAVYDPDMAEGKPIPVRLSEEMLKQLDEAADKLGFQNRTDVIKLCIKSFLNELDSKGHIELPVSWARILKDMDGRGKS